MHRRARCGPKVGAGELTLGPTAWAWRDAAYREWASARPCGCCPPEVDVETGLWEISGEDLDAP